ncbi:uncharacterized protein LOC116255048 [Nymphaea colorata]|nr:uncharacterized protein LOC116255048 [Nymphaea colorata]
MAREKPEEDLEEGLHSVYDSSEDSLSFSDAEDRSWHSPLNPFDSNGGSYDGEYSYSDVSDLEMGGASDPPRNSVSEYSDVDLGSGGDGGVSEAPEIKVHLAKVERDCRICHLSLEGGTQESGVAIELGCSCKDDLAAAHKQCAEAWFKIKGNKTCEICGSTARNIIGVDNTEFLEQWNEASTAPAPPPEPTRSFWHGHRFLNFLLACMVFAFVISWLFHFNVPS